MTRARSATDRNTAIATTPTPTEPTRTRRAPAPAEPRWSARAVARAAAAAAFCIGLGWLAVGSGLSNDALDKTQPEAALGFAPHASAALSMAATAKLLANDPAAAAVLARQALARSPINAQALGTLGSALAAQGDATGAARTMNEAAALGWRDGRAQYWLAMAARSAGDFAGSATHLDAAIRAFGTGDQDVALLDEWLADPQIRHAMIARIATNPPWRTPYLGKLTPVPADRLVIRGALLIDMAAAKVPPLPEELASVSGRLVGLGAYDQALALVRSVRGVPGNLLVDGGFENVPADPDEATPFDWRLSNDSGGSAAIAAAGSGHALTATVQSATFGALVSQAVILPPGLHRLTIDATGGADASRTFRWTLTCLPAGPLLQSLIVPQPGAVSPHWSVTWLVPPTGCPAQRLGLRASTTDIADSVTATFDNALLR